VARVAASPAEAAPFIAACGACHATPERSPPNFLWGEASRVQANLRQCAPRLFARLSMWQQRGPDREKVPMPPPLASRDGKPFVQQMPSAEVRALRDTTASWLRSETGRTPEVAELLAGGYESLRHCLTAGQ
jgi:hypothetical protein